MASSPGSESELDEPTLKEVYCVLVSIQGTVATLEAENGKMLADIIELKSAVVRSNTEFNKLKEDLNNQSKYVASLPEYQKRKRPKKKS